MREDVTLSYYDVMFCLVQLKTDFSQCMSWCRSSPAISFLYNIQRGDNIEMLKVNSDGQQITENKQQHLT